VPVGEQLQLRKRGAFELEQGGADELGERFVDRYPAESKPGLYLFVVPALIGGHPALASQVRVVAEQPVLGVLGGQKLDVVGKVLADGEALESVGHQLLTQGQVGKEVGMDRQGLPGEPADAVGDAGRGDGQDPAHIPDTGAADQQRKEPAVGDFPFDRVIDTEGLGTEAAAAVPAAEALDRAVSGGAVVAVADEPVGAGGGLMMQGTLAVGAERGCMHGQTP